MKKHWTLVLLIHIYINSGAFKQLSSMCKFNSDTIKGRNGCKHLFPVKKNIFTPFYYHTYTFDSRISRHLCDKIHWWGITLSWQCQNFKSDTIVSVTGCNQFTNTGLRICYCLDKYMAKKEVMSLILFDKVNYTHYNISCCSSLDFIILLFQVTVMIHIIFS